MNRFADIVISCRSLPLIYSYYDQKLVSLERALESIQPEINELSRYIKTAKQYCHFPSVHDLTQDESASIYIYAMEWGDDSLCRILNKALRSEDRQALKIWFPYLKLFNTALDKLPTAKEVIWKGVSLDIGKDFIPNEIITWWSVNSCSSSVNVIKTFIENDKKPTIFLIEAVNGKKVSGYTEHENEDEIILKMGTQFRVKTAILHSPNGSHVIHLIEIDDNNDDNETLTSSVNKIQITTESSNQNASQQFSSTATNIPSYTKWKPNGITIAAGNGYGNELNQLSNPWGICIDDDQTIYIADCDNHRIVAWKCGEKNGQIVAGGHGRGNRSDQLNGPTDVIVDKVNASLIISDRWNRRVMRWSLQNCTSGETIISDVDCYGVTMDKNGYLYVSDVKKKKVRRWRIGESFGTIVAGGNGKGDHLNQLNWPTFIFVDEDYSVYVSDSDNHRVMKWMKGAKEGIIVAGGKGQGNSLTQLSYPQGVIVDRLGHIYVADSENHRVMCWDKGATEGNIVVGGNGKGEQSNQFHDLRGLSFDRQGNLYVVDYYNQRIRKFEIDSN